MKPLQPSLLTKSDDGIIQPPRAGRIVLVLAAVLALVASLLTGQAHRAHAANTITLDNQYNKLVFNYLNGGHQNITVRGSVGSCLAGANQPDCIGQKDGDQVLFTNVATIAGVSVDALVTTQINGNSIIAGYFQNASNELTTNGDFTFRTTIARDFKGPTFKFDFYQADTYGQVGETKVNLRNVQITADDLDGFQSASLSGVQAYTVMSIAAPSPNTGNLTVCAGTSASPCGAVSLPGDVIFQGKANGRSDVPEDQAVVTFGEFSSTAILSAATFAQTGYYSFSFEARDFAGKETITNGTDYTVSYDSNQGQGTPPADQTSALGSQVTVATGSGLTRAGYLFSGWNTQADGSGASFTPAAKITVPYQGQTLYAQWVRVTPVAPTKKPAAPTKVKVTKSPLAKQQRVTWKQGPIVGPRAIKNYRLLLNIDRCPKIILNKKLSKTTTGYTFKRAWLLKRKNSVCSRALRGEVAANEVRYRVRVVAVNERGQATTVNRFTIKRSK